MTKITNNIISLLKVTHVSFDEQQMKWFLVSGYDENNKCIERRPINLDDLQTTDNNARLKKLKFSHLVGSNVKERRQILDNIYFQPTLKSFQIITRCGWAGYRWFTLGTKVIGKLGGDGRKLVQLGIPSNLIKGTVSKGGDYTIWHNSVAEPLRGHNIAMFSLMLAFSPPIARFSNRTNTFGFQLVGESRSGKSTIGTIAGSVWGGGDINSGFSASWNHTINNFERVAAYHNNLLLILDETKSADTKSKLDWGKTIMRISEEAGKGRSGDESVYCWNLRFLSTSELTLNELMEIPADTVVGENNRMFDIIAEEQIIEGKGSAFRGKFLSETSVFAKEVHTAAVHNYGHAGEEYINQLINYINDNGIEKLQQKILRYEDKFLNLALKHEQCSHASKYSIECFASVYAAGRMAEYFGILVWPKSEIRDACMFALERSLLSSRYPAVRLKRKLEAYISKKIESGAYDVWRDNLPSNLRTYSNGLVWLPTEQKYLLTTAVFADISNSVPRKLGETLLRMREQGIDIQHKASRAFVDSYFVKVGNLDVMPPSTKGVQNVTRPKNSLK